MRHVFCVYLHKEAAGLVAPPFPGERGRWIYENISQEAWNAWQQHQTKLINEKHLSLVDPDNRKYLKEQMETFFAGGAVDQPDGYIDPLVEN